jgi:hypothetical protein
VQLAPQLEGQLAHALLAPGLDVRAPQLVLGARQLAFELLRPAARLARLGERASRRFTRAIALGRERLAR